MSIYYWKKTRRRNKFRAVLVTIGVVVSTCLFQTPRAMAVTVLTCTGSQSTTFSPGLTYTPQPVTASTSITYNCLGGAVTSGTTVVNAKLPAASCADLQSSTGTTFITWNTGEVTGYEWTSTRANVAGNLVTTAVGVVKTGKFLMGTVTYTSVSPNVLTNACASPKGLTNQTGPATLSIQG
ncbi:hypothetical protein [Nannocystis pusilla]|uniref:Ig-like domain-containing protein n=1 Tax=Nannocystis pusilla TaxID=889268 RepID=A0ABS7TR56_9BACT|nr:hypothetical protein [Nannocystis pusilla]MBZ5710727.1 hypothetical protein [Nannocystis pusilla]